MRARSARAAIACTGAYLLVGLGPASAQTNVETNAPGVQLNFSVPGARSLALGGTFLGRADDATAAYANPAGLANLPRPEASIEVRSWGFTHVFTDRGRSVGQPTGVGIDTIAGLVDGETSDRVSGVSFASFVYPGRRWAVALYHHTLANFEANFATQGAFFAEKFGGRLRPIVSKSQLKIFNEGVASSYRLSSNVSIGLGFSHYRFDIESRLERFEFFDDDPSRGGRGFLDNIQTQKGKDTAFGGTVGVLWRVSPRWQGGAVYRQGPSFRFEVRNQRLDGRAPDVVKEARFNVPDQWGVGAMFQATDRLIAGFDYYRIEYSSFAEDFTVLVDVGLEQPEDYSSSDGDEFHGGLEYAFPNGKRPWFLRSGLWHDPSHGIRYSGESAADAARFRERRGALHWAAGGGVVGDGYQVDLGVDYSERALTFSLSTVARF